MAETLPLDFSLPVADVTRVGPAGRVLPPIAGTTVESRHASYTGALHAAEVRSRNIVRLREAWKTAKTINEIAQESKLPISSVCSLKSAIESELEFVDWQIITWGVGHRETKRSRWRIRHA